MDLDVKTFNRGLSSAEAGLYEGLRALPFSAEVAAAGPTEDEPKPSAVDLVTSAGPTDRYFSELSYV
jgi:hypothetical protein